MEYYLQHNGDLLYAFGKDYVQAYIHFIYYGYKEGRASSVYYNGDFYCNNYADLRFFDRLFLLNHYCKYGINEGRQADEKVFTGNYNTSSGNNNLNTTLLFPLKGSIIKSSNVQTNDTYCDYKTGGSVGIYAPMDGTVKYKQAYRNICAIHPTSEEVGFSHVYCNLTRREQEISYPL